MKRVSFRISTLSLIFMFFVGCSDVKSDKSENSEMKLWTRGNGTSVLEFVPCCRLPMIPGLSVAIRRNLIDAYLLDVSSPNLNMEMTYAPGDMPTETQFNDINVKSEGDCKKAISVLSKKVRTRQKINFFYDGTQGLVAQNGERIISFNIDCSHGGCIDAAKLIGDVEIPARSARNWLKGCAGFKV